MFHCETFLLLLKGKVLSKYTLLGCLGAEGFRASDYNEIGKVERDVFFQYLIENEQNLCRLRRFNGAFIHVWIDENNSFEFYILIKGSDSITTNLENFFITNNDVKNKSIRIYSMLSTYSFKP